jgi:hypothetical protein
MQKRGPTTAKYAIRDSLEVAILQNTVAPTREKNHMFANCVVKNLQIVENCYGTGVPMQVRTHTPVTFVKTCLQDMPILQCTCGSIQEKNHIYVLHVVKVSGKVEILLDTVGPILERSRIFAIYVIKALYAILI